MRNGQGPGFFLVDSEAHWSSSHKGGGTFDCARSRAC